MIPGRVHRYLAGLISGDLSAFGGPVVEESVAGRVRAEQVASIARFTPWMMLANVLNAAILLSAKWQTPQFPLALLWALVVCGLAAFVYVRWLAGRKHPGRHSVSVRVIHRMLRNAIVLGALWAMVPLLFFPDEPGTDQFIVTCLCAGMMCGGAIAFGRIPVVAVTWTVLVFAGSAIAVLRNQQPLEWQVVLLLVIYTLVIIRGVIANAILFANFIIGDIASRNMLEQLARAKEAADAGSRAKSVFLATMSHEIRTPLNGVVGTVDLLQDTQLDGEQRRYVETIQECSNALLELISDILDFSRLEAGRLELDHREVDLVELAEEVLKIVDGRAKSQDLTLVFAPSADLPAQVNGDPIRLRQVLLNLVGNAVKFTERGAVVLRISPITDRNGAAAIRFEVQDTGIGISDAAQLRLFEEFTQVDTSITRRHGGSGLGLAICRKIVSAMGGDIGVLSREGDGSLFWFELPLGAREPAGTPWRRPVTAGLTAALIAADDLERTTIRDLLSGLGLVVVAANGPEDIEQVDVVVIRHDLAGDWMRRLKRSNRSVRCIVYGKGSTGFGGVAFNVIHGAITPSALARALGAPSGDAPSARATAEEPPARSGRGLKILLTEDNRVNQRVASALLGKMGHHVEIAANGLEAVAKVLAEPYDLVLMDMQMPEMDGIDAARAIRKAGGRAAAVPIIAVTANVFSSERDACLAAGMNGFVSKPIDRHKLFNAIKPWDIAGATERPETAEPAADVLDRGLMKDLMEELGEDGLRELFVIFWGDAANLVAELEAAIRSHNPDQASRTLHTLKGAAANLGLVAVASACERARSLAVEGKMQELIALFPVLTRTLHDARPNVARSMSSAA